MSKPLDGNANKNPTIIRDPLYGFVELSAFERDIVSTNVVQRLLKIKQLAHAYVAYPSAMHTRFEHSLGAMHVSGRMCGQLGIPKEAEIIRLGVLLHDIGHGPFSHVFERIVGEVTHGEYTHESIGRLILENDKELKDRLGKKQNDIILLYDEKDTIGKEILSGSLDADKLDYLRRDTHHVGAAYGLFDFERVIRNLRVIDDVTRQYIGIEEKGEDALESYRLARYLMHSQVYGHHTRLVADDMFIRAVQCALNEGVLDKDALNPNNDVGKFLEYYLSLDDYSIQHLILNKSEGKARHLIFDIQKRKLYKRAYTTKLSAQEVPDALKRRDLCYLNQQNISNLEKKIADKAGADPSDIFVHLQSIEIKLYERSHMETPVSESILVQRGDGSIGSMDESPISAAFTDIRRLYVFCPCDRRVQVGQAAEEIIGVPNKYGPKKNSP